MHNLRKRLTFANVASAIALFVALSTGGAYAANTVFSTDIKDGEVKTPDLADSAVNNAKLHTNAVNSDKVKDGEVKTPDLADSAVNNAKLHTNAVNSDKVKDGTIHANDLVAGTAGPRAYGLISGTTHTHDKNVVAVTIPTPGEFCIKLAAGIDPTTRAAVVTPDFSHDDTTPNQANAEQAYAEVKSSSSDCPGQLEVVTGKRSMTTGTEAGGNVIRSVNLSLVNEPFFFVLS